MQNSKAYEYLIKQLNATGSEKKDGYNPREVPPLCRDTDHGWQRAACQCSSLWDPDRNR